MTRTLVSQLLPNADFRSHVGNRESGEPLPLIVVLSDDPLSYMFDRIEEQSSQQAVVTVAYGNKFLTTMHVELSSTPGTPDCRLEVGPETAATVDMLVEYARQRCGSVTCSVIRNGMTVALLSDAPIGV